jgi:hypothetical protein
VVVKTAGMIATPIFVNVSHVRFRWVGFDLGNWAGRRKPMSSNVCPFLYVLYQLCTFGRGWLITDVKETMTRIATAGAANYWGTVDYLRLFLFLLKY